LRVPNVCPIIKAWRVRKVIVQTDGETGMNWWNSLTEDERRNWMAVAGDTGRAEDAWEAFKRSKVPPENTNRENVYVGIDLTDAEALALAQFVTRSLFQTYREFAVDNDEAHLMLAAVEKLRRGLAAAGYSPR
jgi:hypothetical protein